MEFIKPIFKCVNCSRDIDWSRKFKVFCSDFCKEEAAFIRYVKRCKIDGRINQQDVLDAIKIRKAHLLSGGYPLKDRRIPIEITIKIKERDKGKCQICGNAGIDIHHKNGNSIALQDLELVCRRCHNEITMRNINKVPKNSPIYMTLLEKSIWLNYRIESIDPVKICDDEEDWDDIYKTILLQRRLYYYSLIIKYYCPNISNRENASSFNTNKIPTFNGGSWDHKGFGNFLDHLMILEDIDFESSYEN